jgi:hypothetical protein
MVVKCVVILKGSKGKYLTSLSSKLPSSKAQLVAQVIKKFPATYGSRSVIDVFSRDKKLIQHTGGRPHRKQSHCKRGRWEDLIKTGRVVQLGGTSSVSCPTESSSVTHV